jgi:hypothetical protein
MHRCPWVGRALVLLGLALPLCAQDVTPPAIAPNISGTLGLNGWFVSDVSLTWTVVDAESAIIASSGCDPVVLTQDDTKRTFTCVATSFGGTSVASYEIGRDATPPLVSYAGNAGTYQVDQQILITCAEADVTSGVAISTCTDVSGHATTFNVGTNTVTSTATDFAGNSGVGSASFDVVVTVTGMSGLVDQLVAKESVARQLKKKLQAGNIASFNRIVTRETGRSISPADAATLLRLAAYL